MGFPQGINFRATVGYVTDVSPDDFNGKSLYPIVTPQGNRAGWDTYFASLTTGDRNSALNAKVAGVNLSLNDGSIGATFRIDVPGPGDYRVRWACGDASNAQVIKMELLDDFTSLGVIHNGVSVAAGHFLDPTGTDHASASDWVSYNQPLSITLVNNNILRFRLGGLVASGSSTIAHFYVEAVTGPDDFFGQTSL